MRDLGQSDPADDRAKLILHRLVARRLRANPALLEEARTRLQSLEGTAPDYMVEWTRGLERPAEDIANLIGSRSDKMKHQGFVTFSSARRVR